MSKSKQITVIFNEPQTKDHFLYRDMKKIAQSYDQNISFKMVCSPQKSSDMRKYGKLGWAAVQWLGISTAIRSIITSPEDSTLLTLDFNIGRFCSFFTMLLHRRRNIVALNCLQVRNKGILRLIEKLIDGIAWSNENLITSVNSRQDIKNIMIPKEMKKKNKVYILQDPFCKKDPPGSLKQEPAKYDCMTGGYANRDFELFFNAARLRPSYRFVCVGGNNFDECKHDIPENIKFYKEIPYDMFQSLMHKSKVIAIPLKKNMASGLVLLTDAIAYSLPILASETDAVKHYIPQKYQDKCLSPIGDVNTFADRLDQLITMDDECSKTMTQEMIDFAEQWSPKNTAKKIFNIMREHGYV